MKNNNQPLKRIYYQDIYSLQNPLEQFFSWNEPLKWAENFFSSQDQPLGKQRIAKEYYAQAKIFNAFLSD